MSSLDTLARLNRNRIEELQGQLNALDRLIAEMDAEHARVEEEIAEARRSAADDVDARLGLSAYETVARRRQSEIAAERKRKAAQRAQLESSVRTEFRSMKMYEIVSRNRKDALRLRKARAEERHRDELSVARHAHAKGERKGMGSKKREGA